MNLEVETLLARMETIENELAAIRKDLELYLQTEFVEKKETENAPESNSLNENLENPSIKVDEIPHAESDNLPNNESNFSEPIQEEKQIASPAHPVTASPKGTEEKPIQPLEEIRNLNEKLQDQYKNSRLEKLASSPLDNLRVHITINLKIALIHRLYHGDLEAFRTDLDFFESCGDGSSALRHFDGQARLLGWDSEEETVVHWRNLVERRWK